MKKKLIVLLLLSTSNLIISSDFKPTSEPDTESRLEYEKEKEALLKQAKQYLENQPAIKNLRANQPTIAKEIAELFTALKTFYGPGIYKGSGLTYQAIEKLPYLTDEDIEKLILEEVANAQKTPQAVANREKLLARSVANREKLLARFTEILKRNYDFDNMREDLFETYVYTFNLNMSAAKDLGILEDLKETPEYQERYAVIAEKQQALADKEVVKAAAALEEAKTAASKAARESNEAEKKKAQERLDQANKEHQEAQERLEQANKEHQEAQAKLAEQEAKKAAQRLEAQRLAADRAAQRLEADRRER